MKKPLSLYIHIPFCRRKCIYCDFLSFDKTTNIQQIQYINALMSEIRMYKAFADRYRVETIYIGGGTPSVIDEVMIGKVLDTVFHIFDVSEFAEITIEVNPGTIKYTDLLQFKKYGINRLSIGLQSADDDVLKMLGRIHSYDEFSEGFESARRAGFKNISVDIMSGLPGQSIHSFVDTLTRTAEADPDHISVYSLQVEKGTPLSEREDLLNMLPSEETDRKMYAMTKKILSSYGYHRYEISNYSKPGYESRHNKVYWTGGQYIGFGIGSASYFKGQRFKNITNMDNYIDICEDVRDELTKDTDLYRLYDSASSILHTDIENIYIDNRIEEFMYLGLRMTAGVSRTEFKQRFDRDIFDVYGDVINEYVEKDFMEVDDDHIRLNERGIDVSNYILADFIITT